MLSAHIWWKVTHCTETWNNIFLARPRRDKKTPLLNLEEELVEVWWLLKGEEESGLFPLPIFPLIIKL